MTTTRTRPIEQTQVIHDRSKNKWKYLIGIAATLTVALAIVALVSGSAEPASGLTSGFDHNDQDTPARVMTNEPVTGEYFGYSDELWHAKDLTSGFDTADDTTPGTERKSGRIQRLYLGYSPELNPDH